MKKYISYLLPAVIIVIGLFLREYHWQNYPFGFDQIQILSNATDIKHGDFTLIGPRTGPAQMFTGPLIYYLTAVLMFIVPHPYTIVAMALFLSLITGVVLYLLSRRYLNSTLAWIISGLWAFSPFIVHFDRIPWNPNLTLLASILVFFPLLRLTLNNQTHTKLVRIRLKFTDVMLISIGIFLGYQAHFSGLFLIGLYSFWWIIFYRRQWWSLGLPILGFVASLLPTILFDLKHNFINYHGLVEIFTNRNQNMDNALTWWQSIGHDLRISIENIGGLIFYANHHLLIVFSGLLFVALYLYVELEHHHWRLPYKAKLVLYWLTSIILVFSFYLHNKPEYYFLIQFPAILLLIASLLDYLKYSRYRYILIWAVFAYLKLISWSIIKMPYSQNFGDQLKLVNVILDQYQDMTLTFDMTDLNANTLKYLLYRVDNHNFANFPKLHIVYPYQAGSKQAMRFGDYALWVDNRTDVNKHYLETREFILKFERDMELYHNMFREYDGVLYSFDILQQSKKLGVYNIYPKSNFVDLYPQQAGVLADNDPNWGDIQMQGEKAVGLFYQDKVLVFIPQDRYLDVMQMANSIKFLELR